MAPTAIPTKYQRPAQTELRSITARVAECLADTLRVADGRGDRLGAMDGDNGPGAPLRRSDDRPGPR
ncbi:hypothetical protein SSOG_05254 [Streptomyces himastatinicus ATCC 53653]|uniref:Uncharacterized protein n=1 Tax=Streptomyces himastatinicus ATCC 53653 TaxID=457427 RepID=D9WII2_9ACTN|nr:hypothetical protein [Streptomyces himastatinicus]EFL25540.1 hypothetical protein SSOG_05254 [Streptomyces himastatinicus ATCC 53653]